MKHFLSAIICAAFGPRLLLSAEDGQPSGGGSGTTTPAERRKPEPARLAPALPGTDEGRMRRQSSEAAKLLRERAETRARDESFRTGQHVEPEATPSADELFNQAQGGGDGFSEDPAFHAGPTTQAARPGESTRHAPTGVLARTAPVPENQVVNANIIPTNNAPGLGSDSGLKKSADNHDARGGPGGHLDGADPADAVRSDTNPNAVTGIPGIHAEERNDTIEANRERIKTAQAAHDEAMDTAAADARTEAEAEANRSGKGPSEHTETGAPTE